MKVKFAEIEEGFFYVSMERQYINSAFIYKETGQVYCTSELWDSEELPEDIDVGDYIEIPHKNDLDLGVKLVRDFVYSRIPEHANEVEGIFSRKGAYSRFKSLLDSKGLLDDWHKFEDERTKAAIRDWCQQEGIELE